MKFFQKLHRLWKKSNQPAIMATSVIKWNRHHEQQPLGLYKQLIQQQHCDFYMATEGQSIGAHKNVMSGKNCANLATFRLHNFNIF
jgi:hypothetical protein